MLFDTPHSTKLGPVDNPVLLIEPYSVYTNRETRQTPILSILICHLYSRRDLLERLLAVLKPQIGYSAKEYIGAHYFESPDCKVEVIVEGDNGRITIGEKRNRLLDRAMGLYIAYIDDDDLVSEKYCELILKALEKKPDAVGIEGIIYQKKFPPRIFKHSIWNYGWYEHAGIYYRCANHLNPVKRELALQVKFHSHLSHGEDRRYSETISPLIETEEYISDFPIYFYHAYRPGESPCIPSTTKK